MVLAGLLLRVVVCLFLYENLLDPKRDYWRFGWEVGRIAHSLATGRGYSSPLFGAEGPTAWMAPVYPLLLAGVFKLFGVFSTASALAILFLNSCFSAATCIPVFLIARKTFGPRVATWAGWAWAFYPYAIYFSADRVWEFCLTTLLLTTMFWLSLNLDGNTRWSSWSLYGGLWGLTALTSPAVLAVLPFLMAWTAWNMLQRGHAGRFLRGAAVAGMVFVAVISPWFVRNYQTFGKFIPFRDNFWLEVYVGNTGDTSDVYPDWAHPAHGAGELEQYRTMREPAYFAEKKAQALGTIRNHPGMFLGLTARRIGFIWTGFWSFSHEYMAGEPFEIPDMFMSTSLVVLMLFGIRQAWRTDPGLVVPYVLVLLSFPVVYYITHPAIDYRHPIDPLIVILAVYAVCGWVAERGVKPGMRTLRPYRDH